MLPHVRRQTRPRVRIRRWPSALRGGGSRLGKELLGVGRRSARSGAQEHSEGCRGARRGAGALGQQAAPGPGAHQFQGVSALCPRRSWEEILTNMILLLSDFHSVESARFFRGPGRTRKKG